MLSTYLIPETGLKLSLPSSSKSWILLSTYLIPETGLKPENAEKVDITKILSTYLIPETGLKHCLTSNSKYPPQTFYLLNPGNGIETLLHY